MLFLFHLIFMSAATLCLITGIWVAMGFRKNRNWLKIHKTLNLTGALIGLAGFAAVAANIITTGGEHFSGLHQQTGLTALMLVCLTVFLGFYSFRAKSKTTVRAFHRWSGRLTLVFVITAAVLGLRMIGIF
ncbi:MAG TPA: hypothetical protein PK090_10060 [Smithellaceae bacterium]|nr:hypothetical protein [Smithellaceae bacterium]